MIQYKETKTGKLYMSFEEFCNERWITCSPNPSDELLTSLGLEKVEVAPPQPSLEEAKAQKSAEILRGLEQYRTSATVFSHLGFEIDATERSLIDIQGLMKIMADTPEAEVTFRDAHNEFHKIPYSKLAILEKEVYAKGLEGYQIKWALDKRLAEAQTVEDVEAIEVKY